MISELNLFDNSIIAVYFIAILFIGLFSARTKVVDSVDYFLAGRNLGWVAIGLSMFATNISSAHFVGLIAAGSDRGLCVGQFEWLAVFILIFLGWFIAPILLKERPITIPQLFGERFGNNVRVLLASVSIFIYFFTKISVALFAGGFIIGEVFQINEIASTILIILITGIYTVIGGMKSVVNTQILQSILLLLAAFLLTFFGISEVGGISKFFDKIPAAYFDIVKPMDDIQYPWIGIMLGAPILGFWYWCTDQYILQRILSAKDLNHAKKATLLTAGLKTLPIFFIIIPGLISKILYPESDSNFAISNLINSSFIPAGIRGLILIGIISALMSSLASSFNSASALFTNDIYKPFKSYVSEHKLVLVGRLSTTAIIILTICIIPIVKMLDIQIYFSLQEVQAFLTPSIAAVFIFGFFWQKVNRKAILLALVLGSLIGMFRVLLPLIISVGGGFKIFQSFYDISYLYFSFYLFTISSIIIYSASKYYNFREHKDKFDLNNGIKSMRLDYKEFKLPLMSSITFLIIMILLEILI